MDDIVTVATQKASQMLYVSSPLLMINVTCRKHEDYHQVPTDLSLNCSV